MDVVVCNQKWKLRPGFEIGVGLGCRCGGGALDPGGVNEVGFVGVPVGAGEDVELVDGEVRDTGGDGDDSGVAVVAVVVLREGGADFGGPVADADGGEGIGIFVLPGGEVELRVEPCGGARSDPGGAVAGAGVEVRGEDSFVGAVECDDALAEVGEEVGAVVRDVYDSVGGAVDDEGVAAAGGEGEENGGAVAEEGERAVGSALTHHDVAEVPVAVGAVEIAAADEEHGVYSGVDGASERGDERAHGKAHHRYAVRVDVMAGGEVAHG